MDKPVKIYSDPSGSAIYNVSDQAPIVIYMNRPGFSVSVPEWLAKLLRWLHIPVSGFN